MTEGKARAATDSAGLDEGVAHAGDALHGVYLRLDAAGGDTLGPHLAEGTKPRQMLERVLLIIGEDWEETFSLPCRQLAGLEVKNSEKVLTAISGHGGISVSRASLVC